MFGKKDLEIPTPGENVWPFRLGDLVRDKITGVEGVAISRAYHMTGCDRFALQPMPVDNKPADYVHLDANSIELVSAYPDRHIDEAPNTDAQLGDTVLDTQTGMKGIATIIVVPLFGASRIAIQPSYHEKEMKMPEAFFVDDCCVQVLSRQKPEARPTIHTDTPAAPPKRGACRMPSNF